jgi:hypothetical protein
LELKEFVNNIKIDIKNKIIGKEVVLNGIV